MKKLLKFTCLLALVAVACEPEKTPEPEPEPPVVEAPVFTLTSDATMAFAAEAGEGLITYQIENPTQTGMVDASADVNWIDNFGLQVYGAITFSVAINEVAEERTGTITVTYEDQSFTVTVVQQAGQPGLDSDYFREAEYLMGFYYGTRYSNEPNYYFHLSDKAFTSEGDFVPSAWYYRVDAYGPAPEEGQTICLPEGEYRFDPTNSFAQFTFSTQYSYYFELDENQEKSYAVKYTDGTMVVADGKITLSLTDEDGKTHHVTYEAETLEFWDESTSPSNPGNPDPNPGSGDSNLTGDYQLNTENWEVNAYYYGNYYGNGNSNWVFNMRAPDRTGDAINLDMVTEGIGFELGIAGTYTCAMDFSAYTFFPGVFGSGAYTGTWYLQLYNGYVAGNQAPLWGGSIEITLNEDGTHTIDVQAYDNAEEPNLVSVTWTGTVNLYDMTASYAQKRPAKLSIQK